jgi:hypothetical protein
MVKCWPPKAPVFRKDELMRILISLAILSLLFCSCAKAPIQQDPSFQRMEAQEKKLREDLGKLEQQYLQLQRNEQEFLKKLDLPQAQAYTEYKKALRIESDRAYAYAYAEFIGANSPSSIKPDQANIIVAKKQLHSVFANYPNGEMLYLNAITLEYQLSKLTSEIDSMRFSLNGIVKAKEGYKRAYESLN